MRTRRVAFAGGFALILGLTVLVAVESFRDGGIEPPDRHPASPTEPDPEPAAPGVIPGARAAGTRPDRRRDRIRGRIVTRDGRPVPGVRVTGVRTDGGETETRLTAVTDDSGRFEFDVPEEARYRIEVSGTLEGGVPIRLRSSALTSTAAASRDYTVEPAGVFSGRVLDPDGRPVPDARVEAWSSRSGGGKPVVTATTDREGGFRFLLPASGTARIRAYVPTADDVGMPYCRAFVRDVKAGDPVEVRLTKGGEIRGRVTWRKGGPAADLPLRAHQSLGSHPMVIRARTNEMGEFRIGGLFTTLQYRIEIDLKRYKGEALDLIGDTSVKSGTTDVSLEVTAAILVTGRLYRPTGKPARRWHFWLVYDGSERKIACRTRSDGSFVFRAPAHGTYTAWTRYTVNRRTHTLNCGTFRSGDSGVVLQIPDP